MKTSNEFNYLSRSNRLCLVALFFFFLFLGTCNRIYGQVPAQPTSTFGKIVLRLPGMGYDDKPKVRAREYFVTKFGLPDSVVVLPVDDTAAAMERVQLYVGFSQSETEGGYNAVSNGTAEQVVAQAGAVAASTAIRTGTNQGAMKVGSGGYNAGTAAAGSALYELGSGFSNLVFRLFTSSASGTPDTISMLYGVGVGTIRNYYTLQFKFKIRNRTFVVDKLLVGSKFVELVPVIEFGNAEGSVPDAMKARYAAFQMIVLSAVNQLVSKDKDVGSVTLRGSEFMAQAVNEILIPRRGRTILPTRPDGRGARPRQKLSDSTSAPIAPNKCNKEELINDPERGWICPPPPQPLTEDQARIAFLEKEVRELKAALANQPVASKTEPKVAEAPTVSPKVAEVTVTAKPLTPATSGHFTQVLTYTPGVTKLRGPQVSEVLYLLINAGYLPCDKLSDQVYGPVASGQKNDKLGWAAYERANANQPGITVDGIMNDFTYLNALKIEHPDLFRARNECFISPIPPAAPKK